MRRSFLSLFKIVRPSSRKPASRRLALTGVEPLELRQLMANSITLDPVTKILSVVGATTADIATVDYATKPTQVKGTLTATQDLATITVSLKSDAGNAIGASFPTAGVKSIVFDGRGGNDVFLNTTSLAATTTTNANGTISTSLLYGSPNNSDTSQLEKLGVFTVGSTGKVTVDYLYDGAGYRGQLGMFSLKGMESYKPGSLEYNKEAARRALSDTVLGHIVISVRDETAKFKSDLSWEGDFHDGHGDYKGAKTFAMTAGDKFGFMLVPNGLVKEVYESPSIGGDRQPLYSLPTANPYTITPQLRGQVGDLDGQGSLFSFEDLRLDESSDKDYNDMTFQVTGARGYATPVSEVVNTSRNFLTSKIFADIEKYAASKQASDTTTIGTYRSGVSTVDSSGVVGIEYLFDGGGYNNSEMAIFSLTGMEQFKPGSPEFIKEAARRALSNTVLGHVVLSDATDGARTSSVLSWEKDYNQGVYQGMKTFKMSPGDRFATFLVPAGAVWELLNNPSLGTKKTPLFSIPEANPGSFDQLATYDDEGRTFGFEDLRRDSGSDQDYNDIIYRLSGAKQTTPSVTKLATVGKNVLLTSAAKSILA